MVTTDTAAGLTDKELETGSAAPDATKPVGVYQQDDEKIVRQIRLWMKESADANQERRAQRKIEWANLAGHQWEEDDKVRMKAGGRPALTLNLLLTIVAAVEGEERTNRQEIKLFSQGQEDDPTAYGLNQLLKWVNTQCGGEFTLSELFRAGIAIGEGWCVPEVDYFDDPEGKIKLELVEDDEAFPDPLDLTPTGDKSRYFCRLRMITDDEGEARWPGFCEKVQNRIIHDDQGKESDGSGAPRGDIYLDTADLKSPKLYDAQRKLWAVIECWWQQIEPGWVVVNEETCLLEEKTDAELEAMKIDRRNQQRTFLQALMSGQMDQQFMGQPGPVPAAVADPANPGGPPAPALPAPQMPPPIQAKQRPIRRIYQAFVTYDTLLQKSASPLQGLKRFPYVPFRCLLDKKTKDWFGLLKPLLDPQKQHNVEQSVIVQLMQLMPKSGWMAPKGGFHNKAEWEAKLAQPGAMLEYNATRGKPEPIQVTAIPRHLIDMAMTRTASMREISGVNVELTGQRQGSDAGVVMERRATAAKTVLAPIFDNYRRSKLVLGKVLLAYIQTYVSPGRRIRVLGPEGTQYVEMTMDMTVGRYDLIVDEATSTINDQVATLNVFQTTLPQMAKAGVTPPAEFIDMLPMPPHIKAAWKRQILWEMTIAGKLPPPWWQPGMDPNTPPVPPGGAVAAPPPAAAPASAQAA